MRRVVRASLGACTMVAGLPELVCAQAAPSAGSSRTVVFVVVAFAAGWLLVAAWVVRIGVKLDRLARRPRNGDAPSPEN